MCKPCPILATVHLEVKTNPFVFPSQFSRHPTSSIFSYSSSSPSCYFPLAFSSLSALLHSSLPPSSPSSPLFCSSAASHLVGGELDLSVPPCLLPTPSYSRSPSSYSLVLQQLLYFTGCSEDKLFESEITYWLHREGTQDRVVSGVKILIQDFGNDSVASQGLSHLQVGFKQ